MEFTGERFVPLPSLINDEIGFEHLHRYNTVLDLVKDRVVLDIACGEGYGTGLLAQKAKKIYGIDIDQESINHAKQTYTSEKNNIEFMQGEVDKIPLRDNSIDIVVAYETIEHLDEPTQIKFLEEIKRVLKANGKLVISTPDKTNYTEKYDYHNTFHLKEFHQKEFIDFLKRYFKHISSFLQGYEIVSAITKEEPNEINNVKICNWVRPTQPFSRRYLIAVCSDNDINSELNFSSIVFQVNTNYLELISKLVEKEKYIQELSAWGKNLNKEIIEKDETISGQQKMLFDQSDSINFLEKEKAQLIQRELTAQKDVEELKEQLNNSHKIAENLKKHVNDCNSIIQEQKQQIHYSKLELDTVNERLKEIYNSEGWKFLERYYKLKGRLLPEDSKRYKFFKKIVNKIRRKENVGQPKGTAVLQIQKQVEQLDINKFVETLETIEFPAFEQPKISIIIPAFNGWHMNYKCLYSIKQNTSGVSYEVIFADDASTDETKNITNYIKNITVIRNKTNLGFLKNCNHAATFAKGDYIHFLNNDTEVTIGWLSSLTELMDKDPQVGMTGSKLVYPDGRLQEAGGIIWQDASGWNYGHNQDPGASEYNYIKEVDYISGASIMIRKTLWQKLGGFDERYSPAYCEDTDLAFGIRELNMRVVYQPLSVVIHHEGFSHGSDNDKNSDATNIKSYQKINVIKFAEKWQNVLRQHFPNGENVFCTRDRSTKKKTILVIDHYVPHFDKDAGSKTVFQYLKLFIAFNYNVKFIGDNFCRHEPYTTVLQQMGIEVLYGSWYSNNWQGWLKSNHDKFDFILLNRPHVSLKYVDFIKKNIKTKTLYYGHDLHFVRLQKQYEIEKKNKLLELAEKWKEIEISLFNKVDVVLTPSVYERDLIRNLGINNSVHAIKPYIFDTIPNPIRDFSGRKNILFVGGFAHLPNADGAIWFVKELWPLIKEKVKGARVIIAGSNMPAEIIALADDDIDVRGFVSDEALQQLYTEIKLVVIPLRYGAGVKGKTVEAMYNGIPLVATGFGTEGLPGETQFLTPKNNAIEFVNEVIKLYNASNEELISLSEMEIKYIHDNFYFEIVKAEISDILDTLDGKKEK